MGSDFEEDDLYYRGDIRRGVDRDHNDDPVMTHLRNDGMNGRGGHHGRRRGRGHNMMNKRGGHSMNMSWGRGHNGGGGGGIHHDLDYMHGGSYNDTEINADSYNLDSDDMARWNQ